MNPARSEAMKAGAVEAAERSMNLAASEGRQGWFVVSLKAKEFMVDRGSRLMCDAPQAVMNWRLKSELIVEVKHAKVRVFRV